MNMQINTLATRPYAANYRNTATRLAFGIKSKKNRAPSPQQGNMAPQSDEPDKTPCPDNGFSSGVTTAIASGFLGLVLAAGAISYFNNSGSTEKSKNDSPDVRANTTPENIVEMTKKILENNILTIDGDKFILMDRESSELTTLEQTGEGLRIIKPGKEEGQKDTVIIPDEVIHSLSEPAGE